MNNLLSLQEVFSKKIFRIPDYQRGFSWGQLQLEEFWTDLRNLLPDRDHYTGMISLKKISEEELNDDKEKWNEEKWLIDNWGYTAYEVVDGQQRLTTLIILINEILNFYKQEYLQTNKLDVFNDSCKKDVFINSIPLSTIEEDYIVMAKPDSEIISAYKFGYKVDNPSYKYFKHKIIQNSDAIDVDETFYTRNLTNAKNFFMEKIRSFVENESINELETLFKKITQKLKFNMYYINDDFNVFIAFETMNNRGKKLSNLELLKNRLIYLTTIFNASQEEIEKVRHEINETWKVIYGYLGKNKNNPMDDDDFLQNHWMIYFGYSRGRRAGKKITYNSFLLNHHFIQQNINIKHRDESFWSAYEEDIIETDEDIEDIEEESEIEKSLFPNYEELTIVDIYSYIESLKYIIKYWYQIHFPPENIDTDLKKYMERLNRLGYVYFKPLATVIISKKDIDDELKIKALKGIERFIFLHFRLNNYFSTYRNSYFYNLAHDFNFDNKSFREVMESLNEIDFLSENKVARMNGIFDRFERLFKNKGFYDWNNLKYVLFEYERKLSEGTSIEKTMSKDFFEKDKTDYYSVEHIYPQNDTDEYWQEKFKEYTDKEKDRLKGSLGNLLPLSQRINSSLQHYSFDKKKYRKPRGFSNGSNSEIEVSQNEEWTSKEIRQRGMKITNFLEKEFDFIIPSDADRLEFLGLNFLINEEDKEANKTIPIFKESKTSEEKKDFDEEVFEKLIQSASDWQLKLYNMLDIFCLGLSENVVKYTTKNYLAYSLNKVFLEFHFKKDSLVFHLNPGTYNDPKNKTEKLPDSYNWVNNIRLEVFEDDDLEYVKDIILQSFNKI